jgi:hypothetical protein
LASKGQFTKREKSYVEKRACKVVGRGKLAAIVVDLSSLRDKEMTKK